MMTTDHWGAQVTFEEGRETKSEGRNGDYRTKGIDIYKADDTVLDITGINSKGNIGRGHVRIPIKDIPEFIKALKIFI